MGSPEAVQRPFRVGVFSTIPAADSVVEKLLAAGFRKEQISVICSNEAVERHFAAFHHEDPAGEHTPAMAAIGGAIGAALGGLTAVGAAIATGGVALLAAGGLALVTGGVFGGLVGAMMTRGVEKEIANFYDQEVQKGKILVAVEVEENHPAKLATADQIIAEGGAEPLPLREG
jgi:hypothetical protein